MGKYDELKARLRYIATILLANQYKFAVPDHIPAKAAAVRQAATAITTLEAELSEAKAEIERLADNGCHLEMLLAAMKQKRLCDHGRLLFRDDVERHCGNPDICFEYGGTVRCSPCAIKQADAEGVETLDVERVYLPEVARLNRELAAMKARGDRLAEALAAEPTKAMILVPRKPTLAMKMAGSAAITKDHMQKMANYDAFCDAWEAAMQAANQHHGGNDADT